MIDLMAIILGSNILWLLILVPFLGQIGVPGTTFFVLYASSQADSYGELAFFFVVILVSEILGDTFSYGVGRLFSKATWMQKMLRRKRVKMAYDKSKLFMKKKGVISIFLTRFLVTALGPYVSYICGLESFNFRTFFLYVVFGEMLYAAELLLLGYFFKDTFEEIPNLFTYVSMLVLVGFVLYVTGKHIFHHKEQERLI